MQSRRVAAWQKWSCGFHLDETCRESASTGIAHLKTFTLSPGKVADCLNTHVHGVAVRAISIIGRHVNVACT